MVQVAPRGDIPAKGALAVCRRGWVREILFCSPCASYVLRGVHVGGGATPQAIAHDDEYLEKMPMYALQHKVKSGITGRHSSKQ